MGAVVSTGAYLSIYNAGVGGSSPPVATNEINDLALNYLFY